MHISIYLCPSHSTRDTLIAQLPAVPRRHAQQLGSTLHHHWPQICSLYHFRVVRCCVQLCLLLNRVTNGCWCVGHFGYGHSLRVAWAPASTPWGKCTISAQYEEGLKHEYVCGCLFIISANWGLYLLFPTSQFTRATASYFSRNSSRHCYCFVLNPTKSLQGVFPSVSLPSKSWHSTLHLLMGFANSNYQYAVLLCCWPALLLSVHSSLCSPSLSYHALFDMHSEAACILNVCPSIYRWSARAILVNDTACCLMIW